MNNTQTYFEFARQRHIETVADSMTRHAILHSVSIAGETYINTLRKLGASDKCIKEAEENLKSVLKEETLKFED